MNKAELEVVKKIIAGDPFSVWGDEPFCEAALLVSEVVGELNQRRREEKELREQLGIRRRENATLYETLDVHMKNEARMREKLVKLEAAVEPIKAGLKSLLEL